MISFHPTCYVLCARRLFGHSFFYMKPKPVAHVLRAKTTGLTHVSPECVLESAEGFS